MTGIFNAGRTWGLSKGDNWEERGLCRNDPEAFFPLSRGSAVEARAVAICGQCPVLRDCSKLTLKLRPKFGVWAQTTEGQREYKTMAWERLRQRAGAR